MAKFNSAPKGKTYLDPKPASKQDWKRDRYEQRSLKVSTRRAITGGF